MLKAFLVSFALMAVVAVALWSNLLEIFTSRSFFYIALAILIGMLVMAFIILGNPLNGLRKNDKKGN